MAKRKFEDFGLSKNTLSVKVEDIKIPNGVEEIPYKKPKVDYDEINQNKDGYIANKPSLKKLEQLENRPSGGGTSGVSSFNGRVGIVIPQTGDYQISNIPNLQTSLDGKSDTNHTHPHFTNTNNPHSVNQNQVGLGNVDNTSDINKPISTATQNALDGKANTNGDNSQIFRVDTATNNDEAPNLGQVISLIPTTTKQKLTSFSIDDGAYPMYPFNSSNIHQIIDRKSAHFGKNPEFYFKFCVFDFYQNGALAMTDKKYPNMNDFLLDLNSFGGGYGQIMVNISLKVENETVGNIRGVNMGLSVLKGTSGYSDMNIKCVGQSNFGDIPLSDNATSISQNVLNYFWSGNTISDDDAKRIIWLTVAKRNRYNLIKASDGYGNFTQTTNSNMANGGRMCVNDNWGTITAQTPTENSWSYQGTSVLVDISRTNNTVMYDNITEAEYIFSDSLVRFYRVMNDGDSNQSGIVAKPIGMDKFFLQNIPTYIANFSLGLLISGVNDEISIKEIPFTLRNEFQNNILAEFTKKDIMKYLYTTTGSAFGITKNNAKNANLVIIDNSNNKVYKIGSKIKTSIKVNSAKIKLMVV